MSDADTTVKFGGDTEEAEFSITQLGELLRGLTEPLRGIRENLGEVAEAFAAAFAVEKINEFFSKMAEMGEAVQHATQELGMSATFISQMNVGLQVMGMSGDGATRMLERLERNMVQASSKGSGPAAESFKALGISLKDLKDSNPQDVLEQLADAFSKTADGPEKTAIAIALMGRAGAEMIPILDKGREGLEEFQKVAEETGTKLTSSLAVAMDQTAEKNNTLGLAFKGLGITLFSALEPAFDAIVVGITHLVENFNNAIKSGGSLHGIFDALVAVCDALVISVKIVTTAFEELYQSVMYVFDKIKEFIQFVTAEIHIFSSSSNKDIEEFQKTWQGAADDATARANKMKEAFVGLGATFKEVGSNLDGPKAQFHGGADNATDTRPKLDQIGAQGQADKLAAIEIEGREKVAIESIKIKQDQLTAEFNLGKVTIDEELAQLINFENQKYAIQKQALQEKIAAGGSDVLQVAKDKQALLLLEVTHQDAIQKLNEKAENEKQKLASATTDALNQENDKRLSSEIQHLNSLVSQGQLSALQRDKQEFDLTQTILQENIKRLDAEIATLTKGTKVWEEETKKREALEQRLTAATTQYADKSAKDQSAQWSAMTNSMTSNFGTAVDSILSGQKSIGDGLASMAEKMITDFVGAIIKMIAEWLLLELITGGHAGALLDFMGLGSAGQSSALSGGFGKLLGSFDSGSWSLPASGLAMVHQGEMIIPAQQAGEVRAGTASIGGSAASLGGGGSNANITFQVNAMDASGVAAFFQKNARALAQTVGRYLSANPSIKN